MIYQSEQSVGRFAATAWFEDVLAPTMRIEVKKSYFRKSNGQSVGRSRKE
jgi:hypothetical protein